MNKQSHNSPEARGSDDAEVVACADGPLLVRGTINLRSSDGEPIPQSRRTVALCRCGVSDIKPFCDGTHKLVNFKA
ncbi:CDGSH iron-sulfur domain-containing protein [Salinibacterium sp. SWN167]|uniref:CDGSH iron-sulfur domain-containing protein n=1 Tax=Salinibacterium sp. SWN167 TaxID=2792054 RepID=UPI0018CCBB80|nr:CDGSH iron-sulfur domain-containing protein [Salinibacterium sp. SWN167]MBH0084197.1 CDGSH iron-sulfur domain-containing protein [Salinibacterium sp. SWN167]